MPTLAISYDRKVDSHMNEIGQNQYCLNIETFTEVSLIGRFESLRQVRERESAHLASMAQQYREQVDAQYDKLLGTAPLSSEVQEGLKPIDDRLAVHTAKDEVSGDRAPVRTKQM